MSGRDKGEASEGQGARSEARAQVESAADRIRDGLMLTLEELDRRRARMTDVRYLLTENRSVLLMVGGAALACVGMGVGFFIWRSRHRHRLLPRKRREAMRRVWFHPDRVATTSEERPLAAELGRKVVLIFATALASSIAKSSVRTLVPRAPEAPAPSS
ncbi:hypothetical protein P2318_31910 [Myxococcaceae bacterium GXIMD 01537]